MTIQEVCGRLVQWLHQLGYTTRTDLHRHSNEQYFIINIGERGMPQLTALDYKLSLYMSDKDYELDLLELAPNLLIRSIGGFDLADPDLLECLERLIRARMPQP